VGQLAVNSQNTLQKSGQRSDSLSVYGEGEFSKPVFVKSLKDLQQSFPQLPVGFYDTLHDRLVENRFTDQRLKDAVGNVIDTCKYPMPTIANIISYDKVVKRYTYNEMCDLAMQCGPKTWDNYGSLKTVEGRVYWISRAEAEQYGIKIKKP